ncbi:MAG: GntR family transcriptional regulator, partial [Anaerolineae bacterium]
MTAQTEPLSAENVPRFESISRSVYVALRKAIFNGEYRAGDRIVEAEIARQLEISRAPIREALHRLRQAGLVEHRPRRGWFVVELTPDDMQDLYHVRAFVEGLAARRVAAQASSELLDELASLFERMLAAAERENADEVVTTDVEFHRCIVEGGGSSQLHRMWRQLHPHDWTAMSVIKLPNVTLSELAERHQIILDALNSGDPDWA